MDCKDLVLDGFSRIHGIVNMSLKNMTAEQLVFRPEEQANTVAWLAWHLTRVQDDHVSDLAEREQAWIAGGWHTKFGKPAERKDTGFRYNADQVLSIKPDGPQLLLDYHNAVYARTCEYVGGISCADMDRVLNEPQWNPMPTVGVRLISVISDNTQHAGQIAYLRGIIERRHWFPA
jgi:hypothetical protein